MNFIHQIVHIGRMVNNVFDVGMQRNAVRTPYDIFASSQVERAHTTFTFLLTFNSVCVEMKTLFLLDAAGVCAHSTSTHQSKCAIGCSFFVALLSVFAVIITSFCCLSRSQFDNMDPQQQFCLKWNSYSSNLAMTFSNLFKSDLLADVTLYCGGEYHLNRQQ